MNVTAPLRRRARSHPDAPALIRADDRVFSYGELDRCIDRMAAHAARLGLAAGEVARLTIMPPDEATALVLALALARSGIASADPSTPADRLRLSFAARPASGAVPPGAVAFDATWLEAPNGSPDAAPRPIHPGDTALLRVFASSGTTGRPKFIPVTHALMTRRVHAYWLGLGPGRARRMIAIGLGSTWGFATMLRTLWQGGTVVLFDPRDPARALYRHAVTSIVTPPAALRAILESLPTADPPPALASVEVGGSALPEPLRVRAARLLCPNIVSYLGSSEAGGIAAAPFAALRGRPGAVGYLFPDVAAEAVGEDGAVLPHGSAGALRIRSATVVPGYLGESPTTDEARWFHPGDIGAVWPDGMLTLGGRTAELINSGGVKVNPVVIEEALLALPGVTDAAAFGVPDASGLQQIWAAVVSRAPVPDAVLDSFCRDAPPGQAPEIVLQVQQIPRNANGKIRRDQLTAAAVQMVGEAGTPRPGPD